MKAKLLSRIDRFFALSPEACPDAEIAQNFRRNFIVNGLDVTSWMFGMSFVSLTAILPVYASHLTDAPLIIGLIPAINDAGWFLPQLFLAPYVERLARKLPTVAFLGFLERLPYTALALAVLWLDDLPRSTAVIIFLLILIWRGLAGGVVATPWQEFIAKIIPVTHRGRFFGISNVFGQLLAVGGAAIAAWLLEHLPYPLNFAVSFGAAAVAVWASLGFQLLTREPARPPPPRPAESGRQYTRRLFHILQCDGNFRTFLISRWLTYIGGMAGGFLAVYAVKSFALGDAAAAVFTAILSGASVAGYAFWGPFGDRWGHKRVMELATAAWLAALAMVALSASVWHIYMAFALMGFGNAAAVLADLNIAMEFGPEAERPTYIGLTRTVTGPAVLLAPLAGGWLAQSWGYPALFGTALVFSAVGLLVLWLGVRDPRYTVKA